MTCGMIVRLSKFYLKFYGPPISQGGYMSLTRLIGLSSSVLFVKICTPSLIYIFPIIPPKALVLLAMILYTQLFVFSM